MIVATPTGSRKVNSCLSGISLGTVWPYRRRPSEMKKSQVSEISCTSPSDSAMRLADLARDEARPAPPCCPRRAGRSGRWRGRGPGPGVAAQPGWAARSGPGGLHQPVRPRAGSYSITTSSRLAGLRETMGRAYRPPTGCSAKTRILSGVSTDFASIEETRDALQGAGYLAGESTSLVSYLANRLGKPVLVEGPAGVGKTELAKAHLARHRPQARAPPVLRGPRRGEGAVRVELPQAAAADPGRGLRRRLAGGQGRHLRRGVPAAPPAACRRSRRRSPWCS